MISLPPSPRMARMLVSSCTASPSVRLPMVEPGKKPSRGRAAMSGAKLNGREKSPCTGSTAQTGKARLDARLRIAQRRTADVDRHVGVEIAHVGEQQLGLGAGAGAELDEHGTGCGECRHVGGVRAQDRRLGARRIVLRQLGDALEQLAPRRVVEEAARNIFVTRRQALDQGLSEVPRAPSSCTLRAPWRPTSMFMPRPRQGAGR